MTEPDIHPDYPIRESLAPPIVGHPLYECAEAVTVSGFVPHAIVEVWANGNDRIGRAEPDFGFGDIRLDRRLTLGDTVTATQTVGPHTSQPSLWPVPVEPLPNQDVHDRQPVVGTEIYECGVVVPVDNLVPGVRVHVTENDTPIGAQPAAGTYLPVLTSPLHYPGAVKAQQIGCEETDHEVRGVWSNPPVWTTKAPIPTPAPTIDAKQQIPGNDVVILGGLLVGAGIEITMGGQVVSAGHFANAPANACPIDARLDAARALTAKQQLCAWSSDSPPVRPEGTLRAPTVLGPICESAKFAVVRDTVVNATVVVLRNGAPIGHAGAANGDVVITLTRHLNAGDVITAVQHFPGTLSPILPGQTVVAGIAQPSIELIGAEPFFRARGDEQPIDGAVYPRGAVITAAVHTCCERQVRAEILDAQGNVLATPPVTVVVPGYCKVVWTSPVDAPVGKYSMRVTTDCHEQPGLATFYLIFDPTLLGAPRRFTFDDTAVWFGAPANSGVTYGLHYYLHQADTRVFSMAMNAAAGETDPYAAAIKLARMEESLFGYTDQLSHNDVLTMITMAPRDPAQCADDACVLVAFLRAMGIPSYPVCGDVAPGPKWGFDTWVEFLATHNGSTQWRIFHPHEFAGEPPESRESFGVNRYVGVKTFLDYIVAAGPDWTLLNLDDSNADVSCTRNMCGEPNQVLTKAPWINELCEAGYWTTTHWDCAGVRTRSLLGELNFSAPEEFRGRLTGALRLTNTTNDDLPANLTIELISRDPRIKARRQTVHNSAEQAVTVPEGQSVDIPFEFRLPPTLLAGHELLLAAAMDDELLALESVPVRPRFHSEFNLPRELSQGDTYLAHLQVTNTSAQPLHDIQIELSAPFALHAIRTRQSLAELAPEKSVEFRWRLTAIADLREGAVDVTIATADGGGQRHSKTVRIQPTGGPVDAAPTTELPR